MPVRWGIVVEQVVLPKLKLVADFAKIHGEELFSTLRDGKVLSPEFLPSSNFGRAVLEARQEISNDPSILSSSFNGKSSLIEGLVTELAEAENKGTLADFLSGLSANQIDLLESFINCPLGGAKQTTTPTAAQDHSQSTEPVDIIVNSLGNILHGELNNLHDVTSWAVKLFLGKKMREAGKDPDKEADVKEFLNGIVTPEFKTNLTAYIKAKSKDQEPEITFSGSDSQQKLQRTAFGFTTRLVNIIGKTPNWLVDSFSFVTSIIGHFRWAMLRIPVLSNLFKVPFATEALESAGGFFGRFAVPLKNIAQASRELSK